MCMPSRQTNPIGGVSQDKTEARGGRRAGAWQFRRVFWVGFSLEGQEILDLGLRWLAEHLRGGFIFPLD
ncbi:MAG: hypothetical protein PHV34_22945, partial [Verrucomicrobiae bacterium]|nr:hypothetical protein [Verrucomicrobiae bacterium]